MFSLQIRKRREQKNSFRLLHLKRERIRRKKERSDDIFVRSFFLILKPVWCTCNNCRACIMRHCCICGSWQTNLVPHIGRTRYMKCPACGKWSYQKKVLTKEVSDDAGTDK